MRELTPIPLTIFLQLLEMTLLLQLLLQIGQVAFGEFSQAWLCKLIGMQIDCFDDTGFDKVAVGCCVGCSG
jgi:hypothetical protein